MPRSERLPTQKLPLDADSQKAEAETTALCPYCKQELPSATETACPHCGLPIRRRKRQRQITTHGGALAKVVVHLPGEADKEFFLSKPIITLGRHADNVIQINSPIVSNEHARIEYTSNGHTLTDLGSTNGTRVNGQPLSPHKPRLLTASDIIRFSDARGNSVKLTYVMPSGFSHVDVKHAGQSYQIESEIAYIGRGFDAHIVLPHPTVSWQHAKVTRREADQYLIEDVSTHNGTFLNGSPLPQAQLLERGDVIQIGPFNLVYQGRGLFSSFVAERNFRLEAVNLEKTVYGTNLLGLTDTSRSHQLLRRLNLVINPREFVALVGSSGSGKSTLMKALLGLRPASGGVVLINGDNLYEHLETYRHLIGYVPQDDIVHAQLKVRQALRYALQLRLPATRPAHGEKQIDEVLAKVGLAAQAETLVGHLSGGQRKRVSIAAELLADPWIFFLDEPTSGLDPGLEKLMMDTLRHLADEGRTIVLVTHAISHIVDHCDQVAFMARGGELAYFGPPEQAIEFFKVDNFPDIFTTLSQTYSGDEAIPPELKPLLDPQVNGSSTQPTLPVEAGSLWAEHYRQSKIYEKYVSHRQSGQVVHPIPAGRASIAESAQQQFGQFKILARRYLDLIRADRLSLWVLGAVMPLIALFLLLISPGQALVGDNPTGINAILEMRGSYSVAAETQTILFIMALATSLLGLFSAAYELVKEEAIYRRERMLGLRSIPYFASKFGVLGAFMAVQIVLFLLILAFNLRFPASGVIFWAPLEYYITLLLAVLASTALGLFISASATSKDMVTYLVLIVILVQIVFSGAIFELSQFTAPLSYLTITRWALESLGISTNIEHLNSLSQVRVENVLDTGRGLQTLVKDVPTPLTFYINYTHNGLALGSRWLLLLAQTLIWSYLAVWQIRRKDEI
ncbi:MAG: FHA domain-containing protein [Anaerolineae bacterium]|nr:FHA domain-containing protein [Anaerolineae bacterium]